MAGSETPVRRSLFNSCNFDGLNAFKSIGSRSSHRRCSVGEDVLRNFAKFTGNTYVRVNFIKRRSCT